MKPVFTSKLAPIKTGQVITIFARAKDSASRFEIELSEGVDEIACLEIPLQLSVRFDGDDEIVRNSHTDAEGWGDEERMENLIPGNIANPIKAGDDFKVSIYVDVEQFFVSIDDKPFCMYTHRSDITQIRRLNIVNDVERVYRVEHESAQSKKWPAKNDDVFRASIPRSFNIGDILVIKGVTSGNSEGFFMLNILDEDLKRPYFHMKAELSSGVIKVNSQCSDYNWQEGREVTPSSNFFELDTPFKIAIVIKESDFTLIVNGEMICVQPFEEDVEKMFSTMNGIEIISREETKVCIESFEHFSMENEDEDFEVWSADIIF